MSAEQSFPELHYRKTIKWKILMSVNMYFFLWATLNYSLIKAYAHLILQTFIANILFIRYSVLLNMMLFQLFTWLSFSLPCDLWRADYSCVTPKTMKILEIKIEVRSLCFHSFVNCVSLMLFEKKQFSQTPLFLSPLYTSHINFLHNFLTIILEQFQIHHLAKLWLE